MSLRTGATIPAKGSGMDLTRDPIWRLVRAIAAPASVGFFFHTMFNVVDTWFAGQISTLAQAALSLSFPVFFLIIALGNGLATGTTALIGQELGAGRHMEGARLAAQGLVFGLLAGALLSIGGALAAPALFTSLGAADEYLDICLAYMLPIFAGGWMFIVIYQFNAALQAQGDTRSNRNFLILGCLLNVGLDPLFIYGVSIGPLHVPAMGVSGIAWATLMVQAMGVAYLARRLRRSGLLGGLAPADFIPRRAAMAAIVGQGLPATLNYLSIGIGIYIITWFIALYGHVPVAAYGIATRVEQIVLLPSIGLGVAALTLTAQNMGAGRFERVRESLRATLAAGLSIMTAGAVVIYVFAQELMGLFTADAEVIAAGARYLRIEAFALAGYVVLYVHISSLQGAKRPMFAIWIGLFRQIIAPLIVFSLVTRVFDTGLAGVWWSIFGIVWFSALIAMVVGRRILERAMTQAEAAVSCPVAVEEKACEDSP